MTGPLAANELYLMHLLSCALRGAQPMPMPQGVSWDALYALALSNSVTTTCALAVCQAADADAAQRKRWLDEVYKNGMRLALFEDERQAIFAQMDEAGLAHMPMKGVIISGLYPRPEMRWMCDNDFLFGRDMGDGKVRLADNENGWTLRRIMEGRGYRVEEFAQSSHDAYEKAPFFNFEPHRLPAGTDNKWLSYYADPWAKAHRSKEEPGLAYEFSHEDVYIFHVAHMYKHYTRRGHGIRGIADEWVLLQAWGPEMNRAYLDAELNKLGMLDFDAMIRRISTVIVDKDACGQVLSGKMNGLADQDVEVLEYMLESGTYGRPTNRTQNKIHDDEAEMGPALARFRYMWNRLFPPLFILKWNYPILERAPWLLPFVHIYRFTVRLIKNRNRVRAEFSAMAGKSGSSAPMDEKR